LILDAWTRTRLPAKDFGGLLGISIHTLYKWRQRFQEDGPAGLEDRKRGPRGGSRLPDETQRAILLMKNEHPDWGQDRIHAMLMRSAGYSASPGAIGPLPRGAGLRRRRRAYSAAPGQAAAF
jgi:putative transposase